jgi:hypothetical protein
MNKRIFAALGLVLLIGMSVGAAPKTKTFWRAVWASPTDVQFTGEDFPTKAACLKYLGSSREYYPTLTQGAYRLECREYQGEYIPKTGRYFLVRQVSTTIQILGGPYSAAECFRRKDEVKQHSPEYATSVFCADSGLLRRLVRDGKLTVDGGVIW